MACVEKKTFVKETLFRGIWQNDNTNDFYKTYMYVTYNHIFHSAERMFLWSLWKRQEKKN